jgi:hypothetical protein
LLCDDEEDSTRRVVVAWAQDSPKAGTRKASPFPATAFEVVPEIPTFVVIWFITTTAMWKELAISDSKEAMADRDLVRIR